MFVSTTCCSLSNNCRHKLMPVCYRRSHVRWFAAAFAYRWCFVCARERYTGKHSAPGLLPERWSGIHKFGERTNVCCIANPWWYCMHLANTEHIRVVRAATSTSCCTIHFHARNPPYAAYNDTIFWVRIAWKKCLLLCFHFIRFVVHAHTRSYSARCISVVCACMSAIVCVFAWLVFPTAGYRQDKYRATELVRNCNHIFSVVFGRNATHHTNGVSIQFVHRIANTAFSDRNRRILCIR